MLADPQVRIQYASKYAGSSNYYKNSIGMNTAIEKLGVIERKQAEEEVFKNWAAKNGKTQYIDAINNINKATNEIDTLQKQYSYLVEALFGAVEFSRVPVDIDPLKEALNSKNKQLIDSELNKLEAQYKGFANKDYNPMVDKKVADAIFGAYLQDVPKEYQASIFDLIRTKYKGDYKKFIDDCFSNSIFASEQNFNKFKAKPSVKALDNDPMYLYAKSIRQKRDEIYDQIMP